MRQMSKPVIKFVPKPDCALTLYHLEMGRGTLAENNFWKTRGNQDSLPRFCENVLSHM